MRPYFHFLPSHSSVSLGAAMPRAGVNCQSENLFCTLRTGDADLCGETQRRVWAFWKQDFKSCFCSQEAAGTASCLMGMHFLEKSFCKRGAFFCVI